MYVVTALFGTEQIVLVESILLLYLLDILITFILENLRSYLILKFCPF